MDNSYFNTSYIDAEDASLLGPPKYFIPIMAAELALSAVCFLLASRIGNWIGYGIGAWAVALTATLHRHVDRGLSISPNYIPKPSVGRTIVVLLIFGLALAVGHAYFIAQTRQLA